MHEKASNRGTPSPSFLDRSKTLAISLGRIAKIFRPEHFGQLVEISGKIGGVFPRECPICQYKGLFKACGSPPRWDAQCPQCGSLERHRLLYLIIRDHSPIEGSAQLLHFAPEAAVAQFLQPMVGHYISADLNRADVDLNLNIEAIDQPDASVDFIVCSHVLEHVDDARALSELYRILKPGGTLFAMVPIIEGWACSYENTDIVDPLERELHFGQDDHIRYYGADFRPRIVTAGFALDEHEGSPEDCIRYSLLRGEKVFVCTKSPVHSDDAGP